MRRCFVFDIDGTLADNGHRIHHLQASPKEWDAYFAKCTDDPPIQHMVELCRCISHQHPIVYVSGRRESCRDDTTKWLDKLWLPSTWLYLRADGDYRDDDILKIDLLSQMRNHGWEPVMVFDDRTRVVNAWRMVGIPCVQVAPGDF